MLVLAVLGVVSCDLVNRALNRKLLPSEQAPDTSAWVKSAVATVRLTLKTQDAERHACASGETFDELRCEHDANKRKVPRGADDPADDNLRTALQPFKTAIGEQPVLHLVHTRARIPPPPRAVAGTERASTSDVLRRV
jgi:hypothetical protein